MGHSLQGLCCAGQFVRAVAAHICKGSQLFCAHHAHVCVYYLALAEINPRVESMKHAGRTFGLSAARSGRKFLQAARVIKARSNLQTPAPSTLLLLLFCVLLLPCALLLLPPPPRVSHTAQRSVLAVASRPERRSQPRRAAPQNKG